MASGYSSPTSSNGNPSLSVCRSRRGRPPPAPAPAGGGVFSEIWTSQLRAVFSKICQPAAADQSGLLRADYVKGGNDTELPKLLIDGPYGAAGQDYRNYDVLLLVGLGIGATPLISIVKDVLNNVTAVVVDAAPAAAAKKKGFATKRAYFY